MPVKITNLLTSRPIVVPLTTGATLRLSPGQTSEELADVEVKNNAKVDKLQEQGVIEVGDTEVGDTEEAKDEAAAAEPDSPPEEPDKPAAKGESKPSRRSSRPAE
ncbi:MAG: hypothetical protein ACRDTA_25545 [Pseudonocardiaceae bacterium]